MVFLDAYALIALLNDEPAAAEVESLLRRGGAAMTAIHLAEAVDVSCRVHSIPAEDVASAVMPIVQTGELAIIAATEDASWRAAALRVGRYDRRTCALSIADCFLVAAASSDDEVATADPPLAEVVRSLGIGLVALPGSTGARP